MHRRNGSRTKTAVDFLMQHLKSQGGIRFEKPCVARCLSAFIEVLKP